MEIVFKDGTVATYSMAKCDFYVTVCAFVVVTDKCTYHNYLWSDIKYIVPIRNGETEQ